VISVSSSRLALRDGDAEVRASEDVDSCSCSRLILLGDGAEIPTPLRFPVILEALSSLVWFWKLG